jgi:hypothetical protein
MKFEKGTRVRWRSEGPNGHVMREGIVRALVLPGRKVTLPKSADPAKFKAKIVNRVHTRYLVEIPRANARSGRKLASAWLAPKAVTFEKLARRVRG